jgi:hypothetical protein
MMVYPRSLRGDISVILNPMVRDGLIAGFRTNLYEGKPPEEVVITVTAPGPDDLDGIWHQVKRALDRLPVDVVVRVDVP